MTRATRHRLGRARTDRRLGAAALRVQPGRRRCGRWRAARGTPRDRRRRRHGRQRRPGRLQQPWRCCCARSPSVDDPVLDRVADFYADATRPRRARCSRCGRCPTSRPRGWHARSVTRCSWCARPGRSPPSPARRRRGPRRHHARRPARARAHRRRRATRSTRRRAPRPAPCSPTRCSTPTCRSASACVDGEPVSGAAALDAHGVVNLCFAATLPAGRRRGVWSALVWARVNEAPDQPVGRVHQRRHPPRLREDGLPPRDALHAAGETPYTMRCIEV